MKAYLEKQVKDVEQKLKMAVSGRQQYSAMLQTIEQQTHNLKGQLAAFKSALAEIENAEIENAEKEYAGHTGFEGQDAPTGPTGLAGPGSKDNS